MKFIQKPKKQFLFFIVLFFLINLLQSATTELLDDEAYYWVWSKDLAFGYFDHPPLVALWIKISSFFFDGELGVRFFSAISFSVMLYFIFKCIDDKRKWQHVPLFFLLIIAVALLNVYGFITVPDTPLLLFTALFLFAYKRFLNSAGIAAALFLGFTMAGLLYSKYHGLLIIVFVLLSNLALFKNKYFWLAAISGALLFVPHLLWQIEQDFPSVKYHLLERSKKPYRFDYSLMHFVNLIVIVGLSFPLIYKAFFKQKIENKFQKGLQYMVWGFVGFFFLSTFKTSTQAQWNVPILIALVILTFPYFIKHAKARKWLLYLGLANLLVMLVARVFLASAALSPVEFETHHGKQWAKTLKTKTNSRPLVFKSSYKRASKYRFYTGVDTHSYSSLKTRKSQYDLYDFEQQMQHKNVSIVGDSISGYPLFYEDKRQFYGDDIKGYSTFQKLSCTILEAMPTVKPGQKANFSFEIYNPYNVEVKLEKLKFVGVIQAKKNRIIEEVALHLDKDRILPAKATSHIEASFTMPKINTTEPLTFRVAIKFYQLPAGFQGNKVIIEH